MPPALKVHKVSPFARRLRSVREHFGGMVGDADISASEFATRLGLSPNAYRRYERGEVDPPTTALVAIRNSTGVSLDYLVCGRRNGFDGLAPDRELNRISVGLRLRWSRETQAPGADGLLRVAQLMSTSPTIWRAYEEDETELPLEKAQEFAHRFSVTLDFLYLGHLAGMKDLAPAVLEELLRWHPELSLAQEEMQRAARLAARTDKAERRYRDADNVHPADGYRDPDTAKAPTLIPLPLRRG